MLLGVSCNSEKGASKTAEAFLTAYFQTDYQTALAYCEGDVAASIESAIQMRESFSQTLLDEMSKASKETKYSITDVDAKSEKGKVTVSYQVISVYSPIPIQKKLFLTKKGLNKWIITEMK